MDPPRAALGGGIGQEARARRFKWRGIGDGVMRLTAAQLGALPERLDWRRVHGGRRPKALQIAA